MREPARHTGLLAGVLLCLATAAQAEAPTGTVAPHGTMAPSGSRPAATAPSEAPPAYHSVLSRYRPYRSDEALLDWREANDTVGRLHGHAGHLHASPEDRSR